MFFLLPLTMFSSHDSYLSGFTKMKVSLEEKTNFMHIAQEKLMELGFC